MAIEIRRVSDGRAEIGLGEELRHKGRLWFRSCAGRDWVARRRLGTPCARWISHFSDLLFISLFRKAGLRASLRNRVLSGGRSSS